MAPFSGHDVFATVAVASCRQFASLSEVHHQQITLNSRVHAKPDKVIAIYAVHLACIDIPLVVGHYNQQDNAAERRRSPRACVWYTCPSTD